MSFFPETIILPLWFLGSIIDTSFLLYFWQIKWYRLDRFVDQLKTNQGKELLNSYSVLFRPPLAILALFFFFDSQYLLTFAAALILVRLGIAIAKKTKKRLRRATYTKKALLILGTSMLAELLLLFLLPLPIALLSIFILRPFLLSIFVLLFDAVTALIKHMYVRAASKKLKKYPNLYIIGITGSYGKTTVKEITKHILSGEKNVIATPENINSDLGIAKFILAQDFQKKDVFVVEIGAYRIGHIAYMMRALSPNAGVLTAINHQHVALFGSIENTTRAKFEILKELPVDGLKIANADNSRIAENLDSVPGVVKTYGLGEYAKDCKIEVMNEGREQTTFKLSLKDGDTFSASIKTVSQHNASNIGPALLLAKALQISSKSIQAQLDTLPESVFSSTYINFGNAVIIDDSKNSNPDGFMAALEQLEKLNKPKKVVITRGMYELGKDSQALHKNVADKMAPFLDEIMFVNTDFSDQIIPHLDKKRTKIHAAKSTEELQKFVENLKISEAAVLIENRIPASVRRMYRKDV